MIISEPCEGAGDPAHVPLTPKVTVVTTMDHDLDLPAASQPCGEPGDPAHGPLTPEVTVVTPANDVPAPAVTPVSNATAGVDLAGAHHPSAWPGGPDHESTVVNSDTISSLDNLRYQNSPSKSPKSYLLLEPMSYDDTEEIISICTPDGPVDFSNIRNIADFNDTPFPLLQNFHCTVPTLTTT